MTIQTEIYNNVIVFKDKSLKWITEKECENIIMASRNPNNKNFILRKEFYDYAVISKILSLQEYYDQYPDQRHPVYNNQQIYSYPEKINRQNALKKILSGIEKSIKEMEQRDIFNKETQKKEKYNPKRAKIMLKVLNNKYDLLNKTA